MPYRPWVFPPSCTKRVLVGDRYNAASHTGKSQAFSCQPLHNHQGPRGQMGDFILGRDSGNNQATIRKTHGKAMENPWQNYGYHQPEYGYYMILATNMVQFRWFARSTIFYVWDWPSPAKTRAVTNSRNGIATPSYSKCPQGWDGGEIPAARGYNSTTKHAPST